MNTNANGVGNDPELFVDDVDERIDSDGEEGNILADVEATDVNVGAERLVWGNRAAKSQLHDSFTLVRKDHLAKFGPPPPLEAAQDGVITENHVVIFSNLPESLNEIDLKQIVQDVGSVRQIRIVENPSTGISVGNAVVVFTSVSAAQKFLKDERNLMRRVFPISLSISKATAHTDALTKINVRGVTKEEAEALGAIPTNRGLIAVSWLDGGRLPVWAPSSLLDLVHASIVGEDQWTKVDVLAVVDALLDEESINAIESMSSAATVPSNKTEGEIEGKPIKRPRLLRDPSPESAFENMTKKFEKLQSMWIATQRQLSGNTLLDHNFHASSNEEETFQHSGQQPSMQQHIPHDGSPSHQHFGPKSATSSNVGEHQPASTTVLKRQVVTNESPSNQVFQPRQQSERVFHHAGGQSNPIVKEEGEAGGSDVGAAQTGGASGRYNYNNYNRNYHHRFNQGGGGYDQRFDDRDGERRPFRDDNAEHSNRKYDNTNRNRWN
eukprot:GDKJ01025127.1.p1 GENE.GDKJ01025127.1~~GDKJ01025127.1.p1  ORF type:complete len:495 (-),score=118.21 GDKJ01025127.1:68-1552(-)